MKKQLLKKIACVLIAFSLVMSGTLIQTAEVTEAATVSQASEVKGLSRAAVIAKVASLFTADQLKTGVLASVSLAQFLQETGFGQSELFQNANNGFGMKTVLSHNTWSGSTWDGKSTYTKTTTEYVDGEEVTVKSTFRKYANFSASISDHSAYLIGAKKGDSLRYAGISGMTNYKSVTALLQKGGYATDPDYASGLNSIIERYDLTKYDAQNIYPTYQVTASSLNARAGAGTSYKVNTTLKKGTVIIITKISGKWGQCSKGWVNLGYCKKLTSGTASVTSSSSSSSSSNRYKVTASALNVHTKASSSSKVFATVKKGSVYTVTATSGKWGKIKVNGQTGWVYMSYMKKVS